jgi:hypothetical protein
MQKHLELNQNTVEIKEIVHWWGKNQVAEKCRSAILTTFDANLRTRRDSRLLGQ